MYQGSRQHTATLSVAGQRVTWAQFEDSGDRLLRRRREFLAKVVISAQLVGRRAVSFPGASLPNGGKPRKGKNFSSCAAGGFDRS